MIFVLSSAAHFALLSVTDATDRLRATDNSIQRPAGKFECEVPDDLMEEVRALALEGEDDEATIMRCVAIRAGQIA